jgi:hypothetical protein
LALLRLLRGVGTVRARLIAPATVRRYKSAVCAQLRQLLELDLLGLREPGLRKRVRDRRTIDYELAVLIEGHKASSG